MESSYYSWVRGNRLAAYGGLEMLPGHEFRYGPDYTYIDIPAIGFFDEKDEKIVDKGLRNQYLRVVPACALNVKGGFRVQVEPCTEISKYGSAQAGYYVQPGSGVLQPEFYIHLRKDCNIEDIPYAVRLYLRG